MEVNLLGHLRAPYLPRRNPSIPVPAKRQKYCNVSMIICDVLMGYFYGRGVAHSNRAVALSGSIICNRPLAFALVQ